MSKDDKKPGKVIDASKKFERKRKSAQTTKPPPKPEEILNEIKKSLKYIEDTVLQLAEAHEDTRQRGFQMERWFKSLVAILVKLGILKPDFS